MGRKMTMEEVKRNTECYMGNLLLDNNHEFTELPDELHYVRGNINISRSSISKLPDNLFVDGTLLVADNTNISKLPDNLTVCNNLDIDNTNISKLPDSLIVGGFLSIAGSKITELPDNLVVGGDLYLMRTDIKKLPKGLVVGGSLYIDSKYITEIPDDITVEYYIYVTNLPKIDSVDKQSIPNGLTILRWETEHSVRCTPTVGETLFEKTKYVPGRYLYADSILTPIKSCKTIGNYTYYKSKIDMYVIYDGEYYAHCRSFRDGIQELEIKHILNRGDEYKNIGIDQPVPFEDAIMMYRVITGACKLGTEKFLETFCADKSEYTPREIIKITNGQYGNIRFADFFMNK